MDDPTPHDLGDHCDTCGLSEYGTWSLHRYHYNHHPCPRCPTTVHNVHNNPTAHNHRWTN